MFGSAPASAALKKRFRTLTPASLLIYSFALLIVLGAAALRLPECQNTPVGWLDCFFLSASAVCVTGLATVDPSTAFNPYGHAALVALMQLGGLGLLTFALLAFRIIGAQLSLTAHSALADSVLTKDAAAEFRDIFGKIVGLVLAIELVGAAWLAAARYADGETAGSAAWQGIFHAVSAFCNSGFALWSDSLASQSAVFCAGVALLIFIGSIGHLAVAQIFVRLAWWRTPRRRNYFSYNTRVVLTVSWLLIAAAALMFRFDGNFDGFHALFLAISTRTAGFVTGDLTALTAAGKLWLIGLMLIGGGPGSCAGGIKVTTFAIWLATLVATLRNRAEIVFMGRQIPALLSGRAHKSLQFCLLWIIAGTLILTTTEADADLLTIIFEQVSAFGTVGLSLNFTPQLSDPGKAWIILSMFLGRLGPLTIALSLAPARPINFTHPEGNIMIG
ncbi:ktr system potassium uptake protein B [Planctomycetales bacterium]|nr:ktr system potassium uptake protein B [Planctomycetales bacterium]GHS97431.1 ktr system potassium uptake protein B [Planctomycetales bacterium]